MKSVVTVREVAPAECGHGQQYGLKLQKLSVDGARVRVQYERDGQLVAEQIAAVIDCVETQSPALYAQPASVKRTCSSSNTVIMRASVGHLDELVTAPQLARLQKSFPVNHEWSDRLARDQQAAFQKNAGGRECAVPGDDAERARPSSAAHGARPWMSSHGSTLIQTNDPTYAAYRDGKLSSRAGLVLEVIAIGIILVSSAVIVHLQGTVSDPAQLSIASFRDTGRASRRRLSPPSSTTWRDELRRSRLTVAARCCSLTAVDS